MAAKPSTSSDNLNYYNTQPTGSSSTAAPYVDDQADDRMGVPSNGGVRTSPSINAFYDSNSNDRISQPTTIAVPFIKVLAQFFDFDTFEIQERILKAMIPFAPRPLYPPVEAAQSDIEANTQLTDENSVTKARIDLYASWWITTTLIVLLSATGNLSSYLTFVPQAIINVVPTAAASTDPDNPTPPTEAPAIVYTDWQYDFTIVPFLSTLLYSWLFLLPLAIHIGMRRNNLAIGGGLVELVSVVGYSLIFFVPTSLLLVLNISWLRWGSLAVCWILSSVFIVRNIWLHQPALAGEKAMIPIVGVLIAAEAFLVLGIRLQCYS